MARARSSTSQWSLPVRSVNADGTARTRAPRRAERPVQLGEAQVVADREAERPNSVSATTTASSPGSTARDSLRCSRPGQVDVEEVDLAVDGERAPVRPEQHRRVVDARVARDLLGQAAEQQRERDGGAPARPCARPRGRRAPAASGTGSPSARRNAKFSGSATKRAPRAAASLDQPLGGVEVRARRRRSTSSGPRRPGRFTREARFRTGAAVGLLRARRAARPARTPGGCSQRQSAKTGHCAAQRPARVADLAAVEDQQVGGARPALARARSP